MQKLFFIVCIFINISYLSYSQILTPYNLDFEASTDNNIIGWNLNKKSEENGYYVFINNNNVYKGSKCVCLAHKTKNNVNNAIFFQKIDASIYKNKRVRFSTMVRVENSNDVPLLFINVKNSDLKIDGIMTEKKYISSDWSKLSVEFDIASNIIEISFGIFYEYANNLFIDNCEFDIVRGDDSLYYEKPHKLESIEADFLKNFANSYGYIKYFCANKSVSEANWNEILLSGINLAKNISKTSLIVDSLNNFWHKIVGQVNISNDGTKNELVEINSKHLLSNIYKGIPSNICENYLTQHRIVDVNGTLKDKSGYVVQYINKIKQYCGQEIGVSVKSKVNSFYNNPYAHIALRFEDEFGNFVDYKKSDSIFSKVWKEYNIIATIPENSTRIAIILSFNGYGEAYFDDVNVLLKDNKDNKDVQYATILKVKNNGFEEYIPFGQDNWMIANETIQGEYNVYYSNEEKYTGNKSLIIYTNKEEVPYMPRNNDFICEKLSDSIYIKMPLVVAADFKKYIENDTLKFDYNTYPEVEPFKFTTNKKEGFNFSWLDRASRIAMVIETWNYIKHFSLGNIKEEQLNDILEFSLEHAAICKSKIEFKNILQNMLDITDDVRARAWFYDDVSDMYSFPFLFEFVEDKLCIINSELLYIDTNDIKDIKYDNIQVGDEIIAIDGIEVKDFFEKLNYNSNNTKNINIYNNTKDDISFYKDWRTLRELMLFRLGEYNSEVTLKLKRDSYIFEQKVKRNILASMITNKIMYRVSLFDTNVIYINFSYVDDNFIKTNLDSLKNFDKFIFDLRGDIFVSEAFLSLLIEDDNSYIQTSKVCIPVFTGPGKKYINYYKQGGMYMPASNRLKGKFVFLTDWRTTTNGEALVAAVKDNNIGKIIGQSTQGGMLYSISIRLDADFSISLGTAYGYYPNGKLIYNAPIQPDIVINPTIETLKNNRDITIEEAIKFLKSK